LGGGWYGVLKEASTSTWNRRVTVWVW